MTAPLPDDGQRELRRLRGKVANLKAILDELECRFDALAFWCKANQKRYERLSKRLEALDGIKDQDDEDDDDDDGDFTPEPFQPPGASSWR